MVKRYDYYKSHPIAYINCACGCGEKMPERDFEGRRRLYVPTHHLRGKQSHNWKNGKIVISRGYRGMHLPDHPRANKVGYVREHILVFEKFHKCCLLSWAAIHHINKDKLDNRPENLEGMTHGQHSRFHRQTEIETRKPLFGRSS